jgi:hypothetical protein
MRFAEGLTGETFEENSDWLLGFSGRACEMKSMASDCSGELMAEHLMLEYLWNGFSLPVSFIGKYNEKISGLHQLGLGIGMIRLLFLVLVIWKY